MAKSEKMNALRLLIAERLVGIEDLVRGLGLHMPGMTLVARDPARAEMFVVVTNEPEGGLEAAFRQVLDHPGG